MFVDFATAANCRTQARDCIARFAAQSGVAKPGEALMSTYLRLSILSMFLAVGSGCVSSAFVHKKARQLTQTARELKNVYLPQCSECSRTKERCLNQLTQCLQCCQSPEAQSGRPECKPSCSECNTNCGECGDKCGEINVKLQELIDVGDVLEQRAH